MTRPRLFSLAAGFGLLLSVSAIADDGYAIKSTNLRAGPDREYPVVTRIPAGAPLQVEGCTDDWNWCDVSFGNDRGWAYAANISYPYEGRRVPIISNGEYIGLPVVVYTPGVYWDTYYRNRPWYGRRSYWVGRPYVSHPFGIRPGGRPGIVHPGVRDGHPVVVRPEHRGVEHRGVERREVEHRGSEHREVRAAPRAAAPRPVQRESRPAPNRGHGDKDHHH